MRVLVAEDEKKIAAFVRKGLSEAGFNVALCHRGDDALLMATTERFDALVLDIMLPGRDGLSVLRQLREQRNTVPVIFLTARDGLSERVEGLNLGADDYMGESRTELVANHSIPERLARALNDAGLGREEFAAAVEAELQVAAMETIAQYRQALKDGRISPNSLAIGAGIMLDKIESLSCRTMPALESVNVRINGMSRAEALAFLVGKRGHPEPISAVKNEGG